MEKGGPQALRAWVALALACACAEPDRAQNLLIDLVAERDVRDVPNVEVRVDGEAYEFTTGGGLSATTPVTPASTGARLCRGGGVRPVQR